MGANQCGHFNHLQMMWRYCVCWLMLLPFGSVAQSSSFSNWMDLRFKYSIMKPLEAQVKIGYRAVDFKSDNTYLDLVLKYKVHKYFKLALGWRYAGKGNPTAVDAIVHRFYIDGSSKIKLIKKLYLKPRLRYQFRFKDWFESRLGHLPKHQIRARLLLNYNFYKRWLLIVGGEFFTSFAYHKNLQLEPLRFISGVHYTIKNTHSIGLYYNIEQDFRNVHTEHIIALSYRLNLNKAHNKKRKKAK